MIKMLGMIGVTPLGMNEDSFRTAIKKTEESVGLSESDASEEAKRLGLDNMGWGRYGKDGQVTHVAQGGKLVPFEKQGSGTTVAQANLAKAGKQQDLEEPTPIEPDRPGVDRSRPKTMTHADLKTVAQVNTTAKANPDAEMVSKLKGVSDHIQKALDAKFWKPLDPAKEREIATKILGNEEDNPTDHALGVLLTAPHIDGSVNKLKKFLTLRKEQAMKAKKERLVKGYTDLDKRLSIVVLSNLIGTAMQPSLSHESQEADLMEDVRSLSEAELKQLVKEEKELLRTELEKDVKKIGKKLESVRKEMFKKENLGLECEKRILLQTVSELTDIPVNELMLYFMNFVKTNNEHSIVDNPALIEYHLGHVYFRADEEND